MSETPATGFSTPTPRGFTQMYSPGRIYAPLRCPDPYWVHSFLPVRAGVHGDRHGALGGR